METPEIEILPPVDKLSDLGTNFAIPVACFVIEEDRLFKYLPDERVWFPASGGGMTLNDYQKKAAKTAIYPNRAIAIDRIQVNEKERYYVGNHLEIYLGLQYPILGLTNEAGEVAGVLKKIARDEHYAITDEKKDKLTKELGDSLWYLAESCTVLGITLEDLARANLAKLADRQERGVLTGSGDTR